MSPEEHDQLKRDAATRCGPHTCQRSRWWRGVALIVLVVMVAMGLDKLYREDARNERLLQEQGAQVKIEVDGQLRAFGQSYADTVTRRMQQYEEQLQVAAEQLRYATASARALEWSVRPEADRLLDLHRRMEALESARTP